ncbi:hypothetical protein EW146_g4800 [Bondarzewia mesenterica]|uniref:Uncharacterized protein n=1 Tax=Bondarzewia mesenterica TaxID=1095465 RepID=A0A4S4LV94_9AGAM|nr:hypothetical protein EW146_g4800 [Bondarzewia mesenterica]
MSWITNLDGKPDTNYKDDSPKVTDPSIPNCMVFTKWLQGIPGSAAHARVESALPDSSFVLVKSETAESLVLMEGGGDTRQRSEMDIDADADSVEAIMAGVNSKGVSLSLLFWLRQGIVEVREGAAGLMRRKLGRGGFPCYGGLAGSVASHDTVQDGLEEAKRAVKEHDKKLARGEEVGLEEHSSSARLAS